MNENSPYRGQFHFAFIQSEGVHKTFERHRQTEMYLLALEAQDEGKTELLFKVPGYEMKSHPNVPTIL